jgi:hypothetical protein
MAVEAYDYWCNKNNVTVFLPTPINLHTCSSLCGFFKVPQQIENESISHVCKSSRNIHICTHSCGTLIFEGSVRCGITGAWLSERSAHSYWDGNSSLQLVNRRKQRNLTESQKKNIIFEYLQKIFSSARRVTIESRINARIYKRKVLETNKNARMGKIYRSNWHQYYFLLLENTRRQERFIPTKNALHDLASKIYLFYSLCFVNELFQVRKISILVATCVTELTRDDCVLFPFIPWLAASFIENNACIVCNLCLGLASRASTNMLSHLYELQRNNAKLRFPICG